MESKVKNGDMDDKKITIELPKTTHVEIVDSNMPMDMSAISESINSMMGKMGKEKIKKEVTIKEAKKLLRGNG